MKKKIVLFVSLLLCLSFPLIVSASETDYPDVGERVNFLELRLEDFGTSISEINNRLSNVDIYIEELEMKRLEISQQLDVLIVGVNSLYEELSYFREYGEKSMDGIENIEKSSKIFDENQKEIINLTVSGNDIISSLGDTVTESIESNSQQSIDELTKVLSDTNSMLVKLYCMLFALIVLIIVDVLYRFLWNRLFKHAFD